MMIGTRGTTTTTIIHDEKIGREYMLDCCDRFEPLYEAWCGEIDSALRDTGFWHEPATSEVCGPIDSDLDMEEFSEIMDAAYDRACQHVNTLYDNECAENTYIIAVKNDEASIWETPIKSAAEDEGWTRETGISARDFLQNNCGFTIFEIPDMETAEKIASTYHGESESAVRDAAWKILRENGKYDEAKQRQIKSLCDSGDITFDRDGDRLLIAYSDGRHSYKSTLERDEFNEWSTALFDENEALKMLDIADDDDMVSYLIECVGVDENGKNN